MTKEGQVAMDFSGERGKVITDTKEIQQLANTRNKVVSIRIHLRQGQGFAGILKFVSAQVSLPCSQKTILCCFQGRRIER